MTNTYSAPVDGLLRLEVHRDSEWLDYRALGLREQHIPELIRVLLDFDLRCNVRAPVEWWAHVHAWRALGQLGAAEAVGPLLELLGEDLDDDWAVEEIPIVLGMIGPAALESVLRMLDTAEVGSVDALCVPGALRELATRHPETRDRCLTALVRRLADGSNVELNGLVVDALIDMNAIESLGAIEEAFKAERVAEAICGDWEDVQIAFGVKKEREHPRDYKYVWANEPAAVVAPKVPKSKAKLKAERRARRDKSRKSK